MATPLPSKDAFAQELHTTFRMHLDADTAWDIELVEFVEAPAVAHYERFSVTFRAPPDTPPVQNVYRLEHPSLGSLELFLVPIGRDARGVQFQAVFNRLSEDA